MSKKKKTSTSPSAAITHFPTPLNKKQKHLSDDEKIEIIAEHFQKIMETLGLDLTNDSLVKTPYRIAKMYVQEIFSGLKVSNFPEISFFKNDFVHENQAHMVFIKVSFISFCEHHFIPMTGVAYVAYLPKNRLVGISKIHRLVRYFARRPQLQERLTAQIADSLAILLQTDDVAVSVNACHYCVIARGIEDVDSQTTTNVLRGQFSHDVELRREFFESFSNTTNRRK